MAFGISFVGASPRQSEMAGVVATLLAVVVGIGLLVRRDRIALRVDGEGPAA